MSKAPVQILEGSWWSNHEVPLVLPYFNALATSHKEIDLSHRTIRSVDDIKYYVKRIPKNAGAMLYFACHGEQEKLIPGDEKNAITKSELIGALESAKIGAISFIHFGCCEMVKKTSRRGMEDVLKARDAKWVSGYTREIDWLPSMFLDLALVSEVFVPDYRNRNSDGRTAQPKRQADKFIETYEQLARELGFSALYKVSAGISLFPERLHA